MQRAEAAKITWPLGPEWDDDRLEACCSVGRRAVDRSPGDARLRRSSPAAAATSTRNATVAWEEYRQSNPDGYQYSRYVAAKIMLRRRDRTRRIADFLAHSAT